MSTPTRADRLTETVVSVLQSHAFVRRGPTVVTVVLSELLPYAEFRDVAEDLARMRLPWTVEVRVHPCLRPEQVGIVTQ